MADPSQGAAAAQPWQQQGVAGQATGVVGRTTSPGQQILLTIVTLGIWAYVWVYRTHEDIKLYTGEGVGGGLGTVLFFFLSPVTYFLIPNEIETKLYGRDGVESPVRTIQGLWFLLPLVGSLIWYIKMQRALNDYWVSKGAEAPA
jgi:hypothetical protein